MIPYTYDSADVWNALTDVRIKFLGLTQRFSDDPELPFDCSTDNFILEVVVEGQAIRVPDDEVARSQNVMQPLIHPARHAPSGEFRLPLPENMDS